MTTRNSLKARVLRPALLLMPALLGWTMALAPANANAATNRATGNVAGGVLVGGDGTGDAAITLESVQLALVKQARDAAGNVLASGTQVTPGQAIWFVLYIDNVSAYPAAGIRISDILDESQFTYVPNTIQTTTAASGTDDATLWASAWAPQTDVVGAPDDLVSITDTSTPPGNETLTVGEVIGQSNAPVSIPANTILAVRFRVTVN